MDQKKIDYHNKCYSFFIKMEMKLNNSEEEILLLFSKKLIK